MPGANYVRTNFVNFQPHSLPSRLVSSLLLIRMALAQKLREKRGARHDFVCFCFEKENASDAFRDKYCSVSEQIFCMWVSPLLERGPPFPPLPCCGCFFPSFVFALASWICVNENICLNKTTLVIKHEALDTHRLGLAVALMKYQPNPGSVTCPGKASLIVKATLEVFHFLVLKTTSRVVNKGGVCKFPKQNESMCVRYSR